jgi:hypothetical protein
MQGRISKTELLSRLRARKAQGQPTTVDIDKVISFVEASADPVDVTLPDYVEYAYVSGSPLIGGCAIFPPDNPWNKVVSGVPVDPRSAALLANMNPAAKLHPDFGSDPTYGIPWVTVSAGQPKVPVTFKYADESDPGPYPIPPDVPIEAGDDKHVIVLDTSTCKLYEMYLAAKAAGGGWTADSGAVFDLKSNALRPDGWTSADAAGLPILPGLVRRAEIAAGRINHALRFTLRKTRRAYVHPATHYASTITDPNFPPMGLRVRLKSSFDISAFNPTAKVILTAMKEYGMFLCDNGGDWFFTGERGAWVDTDLAPLKTVPATAFEVVQLDTIRT